MSKKTFVYIAICAVIIILAFVIGRSIGKRNLKNSTGISSNTATYYCEEGTIHATFATSSVALSFSDGRTMNLPQTISASGARYEADRLFFGMKAMMHLSLRELQRRIQTVLQELKNRSMRARQTIPMHQKHFHFHSRVDFLFLVN